MAVRALHASRRPVLMFSAAVGRGRHQLSRPHQDEQGRPAGTVLQELLIAVVGIALRLLHDLDATEVLNASLRGTTAAPRATVGRGEIAPRPAGPGTRTWGEFQGGPVKSCMHYACIFAHAGRLFCSPDFWPPGHGTLWLRQRLTKQR